MEEELECDDVEQVRPLDVIIEANTREFESGKDTVCDKDLDAMVWKLGDFENEEPPEEAEEFAEEPPVEEELVEKQMIVGGANRASFREGRLAEEPVTPGESVATASSIGSETGRKRKKAVRRDLGGKKKK